MVSLPYHSTFSLTTAAVGVPVRHLWNINNAFSLDGTGVTHQPKGFDQYMLFYNHWTVMNVNVMCTFATGGAGAYHICGLHVDRDAAVLANADDYEESKYTITRDLDRAGSSRSFVVINMNVNPSKFLGSEKDLTHLEGTVGAGPLETCFLHVWVRAHNTVPNTVRCRIKFQLTLMLTEPTALTQS